MREDCMFVSRVINSCITEEQLYNAMKLIPLLKRKHGDNKTIVFRLVEDSLNNLVKKKYEELQNPK